MPTLLRVSTSSWRLEVAGPYPALPDFLPLEQSSITFPDDAQAAILDPAKGALVSVGSSSAIKPLLFENTDYDFYFEPLVNEARFIQPIVAVFRHNLKGLF